MAVRRLDLEAPARTTPSTRPTLRLVPTPPRAGRPVAAALFVAVLMGALGWPALRAATAQPPAPRPWSYRPPSAAQIPGLDATIPPGETIPASREPVGGLVFVRCTRLWAARPDGSGQRRIGSMTGISSPAISPDARTIAFLAPAGDATAIWMSGGDGSNPRAITELRSDGAPIAAEPMNLTWSPAGGRLAFALVDDSFDPWSGGSSIWSFDLKTGEFEKEADGWPAPFWMRNRVGFAGWMEDRGETLSSVGRNGNARREGRLSSGHVDLTADVSPYTFSDGWSSDRGVVVLRRADGDVVVAVKRSEWTRATRAEHRAPRGYAIPERSPVGLSQETSRAVVDLVDRAGDPALGLLDLRSGKWTVLGYAWHGEPTPAPTASGPLGARRASRLAGDLLNNWRDDKLTALLVGHHDEDLLPFRPRGHILGTPQRADKGWSVPAVAYGRADKKTWAYRSLAVGIVPTKDGRLVAEPRASSAAMPIATLADARAFLEPMLGERFRWPAFIPAGAELNLRWPVSAYSWGDEMQATVNLEIPDPERTQPRTLSLAYGDVDFSLGCGGENYPEEGEVGEEPGLYDHISYKIRDGRRGPFLRYRTDQVLWPATLKDRSAAFYSVYGDLGRATITRIAASFE